MTPIPQAAHDAWRALLGKSAVLVGTDIPSRLGTDTSTSSRRISAVLQVSSAEQLPELMQIAQTHRVKVHPVSTASNWGYGGALPADQDITLIDLSRLNRIIDFDTRLGVVTVEPGVTQGMLADFLDAGSHAYMVPVTGAGPNVGLLSNALERGYGITPYTDHFGAITDLEAVLADGSLYRSALREAGSDELARLFKWGIGPYVNGLFTQSGFGVVTRMSILLARRPEMIKVCLFNLADEALLEPAIERIQELLRTLPATVGGLNLMNRHRVLAMTAPYPAAKHLDSDGLIPPEMIATLGRQYQIPPWTGFATLYGRARVVKAAQKEIRHLLRGVASRLLFLSPQHARWITNIAQRLPGAPGEKLKRTANTLNGAMELVQGRPNETALPLVYWRSRITQPDTGRDPSRDRCGLLWYAPLVPMRPEDIRRFVDFALPIMREHGLEPLVTLTSQGDRLFDSTIPLLFDLQDAHASQAAQHCLARLTEQGQALGFYPYRLHVDAMRAHAERHPTSSQFIRRLRSAIDPDDLLAPGRYT